MGLRRVVTKPPKAWCVQDASGRCLAHCDAIHGEDVDAQTAVALAKAMIRDGRMPTPEDAQQQLEERLQCDRLGEPWVLLQDKSDHPVLIRTKRSSKEAPMSQRESGYQRKPLDQYETPAWVTLALIPHLPEFTGKIWEPACGSGKMVAALRQAGFDVVGSDITQGVDFLQSGTGDGCQRDHHQSTLCSGARVHRARLAVLTTIALSQCSCARTSTTRLAERICSPTVRCSPRKSCFRRVLESSESVVI